MQSPFPFPLVYVTRDIERALGLSLPRRDFFIISNATSYATELARRFPESICLIPYENAGDGKMDQHDTHELLAHPQAAEFIKNISEKSKGMNAAPHILVFKNTALIERLCKTAGWPLLNPSASLSQRVEEKISQVEWLGALASEYLPPHRITTCKEIVWHNKAFILQFNHAHSGEGTLHITNAEDLAKIQAHFPDRAARVTDFIEGPVFTSNNVVTDTRTLMGNVSYQITGIAPFTTHLFTTIGNDWALPGKILTPTQHERFKKIVEAVGTKLRASGWKGLFGIDVILSEKTGELFLLEINARQPASTTYESQLQTIARERNSAAGLTTFEAHLVALCGDTKNDEELIVITDGAQIIQRMPAKTSPDQAAKALVQKGFGVVLYDNTHPGSDLVRIQSAAGFMEDHGVLNKQGQVISDLLQNL